MYLYLKYEKSEDPEDPLSGITAYAFTDLKFKGHRQAIEIRFLPDQRIIYPPASILPAAVSRSGRKDELRNLAVLLEIG